LILCDAMHGRLEQMFCSIGYGDMSLW
jgi:hypothetical protein